MHLKWEGGGGPVCDDRVVFASRQHMATYRTTGDVSISSHQWSTCGTPTLQAIPCLLQFLSISDVLI